MPELIILVFIIDPYEDQFEKKIQAKKERIAKNEYQRLRNIAKSKKIPGELGCFLCYDPLYLQCKGQSLLTCLFAQYMYIIYR